MKKLIFIYLGIVTLFSFISCDSRKSAIDDLKSLVNNVEVNYDSFTQEDWDNISLSYSAIEEELQKHEYTDEELDEIGRLKGKYLGLQTKHTIENIEKRATDFGKQLDGVIEGFSDVFSQEDQD